jgi:hypothetical protein
MAPLIIVALLLVGRALLPIYVTHFVNGVLSEIPDHHGTVEDVDLHLWRGAYSVHGIEINHIQGERVVPVFTAPRVDLSVEWRALFRGTLVGEIEIYQPKISILAGPAKKEEKVAADSLIDRFRRLNPLRIDRFVIHDGQLHFRNLAADPDVDIHLRDIQVVAHNLTNSDRLSETLVATVSGEGRAMSSGFFTVEMKLDPFAQRPTFDLAFELKNLSLPELNSYLKHYLSVEARDGRLSFYTECSAREGRFNGYVKPFVQDLDILRVKDEKKSVGEVVKGFFVKIFAEIFENKPNEQVATKIEFSGEFDDPEVSIWEAVIGFMRNAFVQALTPGLEGSVAPAQVEDTRDKRRPVQKERDRK